jgi:hypothetical protein
LNAWRSTPGDLSGKPLGAAVISAVAPTILRPNSQAATSQLVNGDRLTLHLVLAAIARLRGPSSAGKAR